MKKELKERSSQLILLAATTIVAIVLVIYLVIPSLTNMSRDTSSPVNKDDSDILNLVCFLSEDNITTSQTWSYKNNELYEITTESTTTIIDDTTINIDILKKAQLECENFKKSQSNYSYLKYNCNLSEQTQTSSETLQFQALKQDKPEIRDDIGSFTNLSKYDLPLEELKTLLETNGYTCN